MSHTTTYDQLIADKLQGLPVPDMANAIWQRIEQQLNVEMPVENTGSSNGIAGLPGQLSMGIGIVVVVAVLVGGQFLLRESTPYHYPAAQKSVHVIPAPEQKVDSQKTPILRAITPDIQSLPDTDEVIEQNVEQDLATIPQPRTVTSLTPLQPMPERSIQETEVVPSVTPTLIALPDSSWKQSRGVKGISPNDYRIAPVKKDTL